MSEPELPQPPADPNLRASDAERERTADTLRTAATEGRLTFVELEERLSSVYAARTRSELELLITDVSLRSIADEHMSAPTSAGVPPEVREGPGGTRHERGSEGHAATQTRFAAAGEGWTGASNRLTGFGCRAPVLSGRRDPMTRSWPSAARRSSASARVT